jgi:hypothetical protein
MTGPTPLVAVTDHAEDRYRQRVARRTGKLELKPQIAGRVDTEPPPGAAAQRGSVYVRDGSLVFACLHDRPRGELVVVTVWEEGEGAAVPRRYTDAVPEPRLRRPGHSA